MWTLLNTYDDSTLAVKASQGNRKAFGVLYDRHMDKVYNFVAYKFRNLNPDDLMDITSQTFYECVTSLQRFEGKSSFRTWLFAIAVNCGRHYLSNGYRKRARTSLDHSGPDDEENNSWDVTDIEPTPEETVAQELESRMLWDAIGKLQPKHQDVTLCRYIMDLSTNETAEFMLCSEDNVKTMLSRALKELKPLLEKRLEGAL